LQDQAIASDPAAAVLVVARSTAIAMVTRIGNGGSLIHIKVLFSQTAIAS
jgi:hypothetical protein